MARKRKAGGGVNNAVNFKVRTTAMMLKQFTVAEIVAVTGLNPESVRTVIQRLRKGRFVETVGKLEGRPREACYRISGDQDLRAELFESVEPFLPGPVEVAIGERPRGPEYRKLVRLLDEALHAPSTHFLTSAADAYDFACAEEDIERASPAVRAYLAYERGRLDYLLSNDQAARTSFLSAREVFEEHGDQAMLNNIDEYLLCLATRELAGCSPASPSTAIRWIRALLAATVKQGYKGTDNPLWATVSAALRLLVTSNVQALSPPAKLVKMLVEPFGPNRASEITLRLRAGASPLWGEQQDSLYQTGLIYQCVVDNCSPELPVEGVSRNARASRYQQVWPGFRGDRSAAHQRFESPDDWARGDMVIVETATA